jgi:hypothetical protein
LSVKLATHARGLAKTAVFAVGSTGLEIVRRISCGGQAQPPAPKSGSTDDSRVLNTLDQLATAFGDHRLVAAVGQVLPATLAEHLDLRALFDQHVDLGSATVRANAGTEAVSLIRTAPA